jgi:hypothetical protein
VKSAAIGAWLPDLRDSKKGGGDIDNHVFKMLPYAGDDSAYYVVQKAKLLRRLGNARAFKSYLESDRSLGPSFWNESWKAKPKPGQHLANRAMALTTALVDMLILGDPKVARLVPGTIRFAGSLDPETRSRKAEIATYFFMLSHFVADSCMPCHCDGRRLAAYDNGLHKQLEKRWSKDIGTYFEKKRVRSNNSRPSYASETARAVLAKAEEIGKKLGITFPQQIPKLENRDVWIEIVNVCRASFAVACILAPLDRYSFETPVREFPWEDFAASSEGRQLLPQVDKVVLHDSVLNIAIIWKHIWKRFED